MTTPRTAIDEMGKVRLEFLPKICIFVPRYSSIVSGRTEALSVKSLHGGLGLAAVRTPNS
jgi:hypothetical protein